MKTIQPMALVGIMLLLPPLFLGLGVWQGCHLDRDLLVLLRPAARHEPGIDTHAVPFQISAQVDREHLIADVALLLDLINGSAS